ncbi:hypothetical protein Pla123a_32460 [Posidoniimonas polymericola]|uniref:Protein SlyX n=1 Tax=Posidoniimonas polymericola TaxID=2528002 RepID=A0A5C5YH88_9BACT|nr:SlyX family protein [Posidoniimonas polymericola]TWT74423.1 hypothetical protein Pla123a_32460 [Posidoniimonas polymericola]
MTERQTKLEELLAHQQQMLDDLNSVVTGLRRELDMANLEQVKLKRTVARLVEYYESAEGAADEKPPHY